MRGALSHVEQHAFGHFQDSGCTLDIVLFFHVESFLQTKERTLARALGVVSALCFSLVLILGVFFNIYIPSPFP